MGTTIASSIFSVRQCRTLVYVTNSQTAISFLSARATAGSSSLPNRGSITVSLRTNTTEGSESHRQRRKTTLMINMAQRMKTRKNIPMKRSKLKQVSPWVSSQQLA
jgi:hypothetical protein